MKMNLKAFIGIGLIFVWVVGVLMHFAYEWSGENRFVSLFAPVNESTWEHMKLVFFPMLIYSIFGIRALKSEFKNIAPSMFIGILVATFLIPVLFYTYSGVLGYNKPFFDIATFFISTAIGFYVSYILIKNLSLSGIESLERILLFIIIIVAIMFFAFTLYPPKLGIFIEPKIA